MLYRVWQCSEPAGPVTSECDRVLFIRAGQWTKCSWPSFLSEIWMSRSGPGTTPPDDACHGPLYLFQLIRFWFCNRFGFHVPLGALVCVWHLKRPLSLHKLLCLDVPVTSVYFKGEETNHYQKPENQTIRASAARKRSLHRWLTHETPRFLDMGPSSVLWSPSWPTGFHYIMMTLRT